MNMIDKVSYVKLENLSNYSKYLNFEKSKHIKSMCRVFNNRKKELDSASFPDINRLSGRFKPASRFNTNLELTKGYPG